MNVVFRGVMLFCTTGTDRDTVLHDVLLPDCEDRIPPCGAKHGDQVFHLDGTRAVTHYAGALVAPTDEPPIYYPLRGVNVTIGVPSNDQPKIGDKINGFTKTREIKEDGEFLDVNWQARRASRITLGAGPSTPDHFKAKGPSYDFKVGKKQSNLHHVLSLTYPDDVQVTTSSPKFPQIPVPSGATLYIYNFEEREPSVDQLESEHETTRAFIIDHDFKWVYSLLKPRDGKKLDEWARGYLPAPVWGRPSSDDYFSVTGKRAITVSTCFPGST